MAQHKSNKTTYKQQVSAMNAEKKKTSVRGLATLLSTSILLCVLLVAGHQLIDSESEVLFKSQEQSLWLPGETFYRTLSIYPGGMLSWLGCYMTQFFYHPAMGVWLMMSVWAVVMGLSQRLFRLRGWKMLLVALVPLMLLAILTQTGYWVYYQKLPGHMWVPTLGVGISLVIALAGDCMERFSAVSGRMAKMLLMVATAWFGYQWMGAWSFLALALMAANSITIFFERKNGSEDNAGNGSANEYDRLNEKKTLSTRSEAIWCGATVLLAVVLAGIIPQIEYNIFDQTMRSEVYVAGMPCFRYGQDDCPDYRTAYYLLALCFVVLTVASLIKKGIFESKVKKTAAAIVILALLGGASSFALKRWNHDKNFHAEIAMANAIERQDWEGALQTMAACANDTISPTRVMVMMKNLALFRVGRVGDEMFMYPEGSRQQEAEWTVRMTQVGGKMLYYNYGKLNFCYRWCMEDGVEFGWRVEQLKYMALCAMLKGEDAVAHKYFNLLKKTRYHKEWAEKYEPFIGHQDKMREDTELSPITYLKEFGDRLDADNTLVELYLLQTFANGRGADPVYQECTLMCSLIMKDIDLFWPRFAEYCNRHAKEEGFYVPRYYQEAAYLYCQLEPQKESVMWPGMSNAEAMKRLPFDQGVIDRYQSFMQFNSRPDIAPLSEQEKARAFKPLYSNTFYYFYFLMRNQKTN